MYLVYLDEVKHQKNVEPYFWLCGLAFPEDVIRDVEKQLSTIASSYFGTPILDKSNEFHAIEIVQGKGPFKNQELPGRVSLIKSLIDVIADCPRILRIVVRIDPSKMFVSEYEDKAFMFFVEKVDILMKGLKSLAMIIADHDKDAVSSNVSNLSSYKEFGTHYQFGREIKNIIDTIHHTYSHHSRLLQLADIYVYTMAMIYKDHSKYPKSEIYNHISTKGNYSFPSTYKIWPTDQSWWSKP